ncbi:MAG: SIR2 family protein [Verrucomicrobiales bacterium]
MPRKTLIFGNGLGMALDNEAFALDRALKQVWENDGILSEGQRDLIRLCLPEDTEFKRPSSEDDLDLLQRVLSACDFLDGFDDVAGAHWLSEEGRAFPPAIRRFVHQVAACFHNTGHELPEEFASPLCDFLHKTKSHVATLNYDPLLYQCFLNADVLAGYNGDLIDGMINKGFETNNLDRRNPEDLGWYLHLHGSPLFYDAKNGRVRKLTRNRLDNEVKESTHLVLTHVRHKQSIIATSSLLSAYWRYLGHALKETEEVILIGYSGYDEHLNDFITRRINGFNVRVVEWASARPNDDRSAYWKRKLKTPVEVEQYESILEFVDW